jgi:hypothetical protein
MNLLGIALSLLVLWLWYTRQESFTNHKVAHTKYIVSGNLLNPTLSPRFNWRAPIDPVPESPEVRRGLPQAYNLPLDQEMEYTISEIMEGHPSESEGTSLHVGQTVNLPREDIWFFKADQIRPSDVRDFLSQYGE